MIKKGWHYLPDDYVHEVNACFTQAMMTRKRTEYGRYFDKQPPSLETIAKDVGIKSRQILRFLQGWSPQATDAVISALKAALSAGAGVQFGLHLDDKMTGQQIEVTAPTVHTASTIPVVVRCGTARVEAIT